VADAQDSSGDAKRYFAYGSNMLRRQILERCPNARFLGPACLRDHALAFTRRSERWGGGVADVIASAGSETWGGLYAITAADIAKLDQLEGHPHSYERRRVVVEHIGAPVAAWAYVVVAKQPAVLPTREYWQAIVAGAVDCDLPEPYIAALRALAHGE